MHFFIVVMFFIKIERLNLAPIFERDNAVSRQLLKSDKCRLEIFVVVFGDCKINFFAQLNLNIESEKRA